MRPISRTALLVALLLFANSARAANPVVRFTTLLGNFDVELCNELSTLCLGMAAGSVTNFLNYVDRGAYQNSIIHRSQATPFYAADFVIQGGCCTTDGTTLVSAIALDPPAVNEFNQSNKRGTVALARSSAVDSGTSQWFINLADNGGVPPNGLDYQNEGFTVFGVVAGDGMQVVDAIADLTPYQVNSAFFNPIYDPDGIRTNFSSTPMRSDFVPGNVTLPEQVLPYFITMNITRVPQPGAGLAGAVAIAALAVLTRGRA